MGRPSAKGEGSIDPVPVDSQMPELQAAISNFLKDRYAGPENAATREAILVRFNIIRGHYGLSDRKFRDIVADPVVNFKKPICTSAYDYCHTRSRQAARGT